ncbi:hypothetical protein P879_09274 [Paragonimus westermani]|uniref:Tetraspanin n=1 Tax=Paragonimus westermani TaxID=34504 RepID=A0A8T0D868_9TREM|nr:hypothetical protein P879_09274 [Paragonimus westermani]
MVSLSCGYRCLQILLILLNSLVLICGVGLIVLGAMAEVSLKTFGDPDDKTLQTMVITVICLGCVIFIVGFLGFCGACMKNVCMLITYSVILGLLSLAEVACGIAGLVLRDQVPNLVKQNLNALYAKYSSNKDVQNAIDYMQKTVKCCGPNGVWTSGAIPESCYNSDGTQYNEGCVDSMNKLIQSNLVALGICVFIFALIQIICMIFALCVVNALQKGESETV